MACLRCRATTPFAGQFSTEGRQQIAMAFDGVDRLEVDSDGDLLIHVGDRSRAEIALVNQSKVRIDQNTTVRLTRIAPDGGSLLAIARGAAAQYRAVAVDQAHNVGGRRAVWERFEAHARCSRTGKCE
jgi:hypothetical protein